MATSASPRSPETSMSPRSEYSRKRDRMRDIIVEVMVCLDADKISSIKDEFSKHPDSAVDLHNFICVMEAHLDNYRGNLSRLAAGRADDEAAVARAASLSAATAAAKSANYETKGGGIDAADVIDADRQSMVHDLIELFDEIDVNGDQMMEWDEFTEHIVEKAFVFDNQYSIDSITDYQVVLEDVTAKRSTLHGTMLDVCFVPPLDLLVAMEDGSTIARLYNLDDCNPVRVWDKETRMEKDAVLEGQRGLPLCAAFVGRVTSDTFFTEAGLVTACADSSMVLWELHAGSRFDSRNRQYSMVTRWPAPHPQCSLHWVPERNKLFSASSMGMLHVWDIASRTELSCMQGHTDMVMEMCTIDDLDNIASCSLDKTICVWDINTGARRQRLSGHKRGVAAITYCAGFRLLISAGYDHEVLVWNPFCPTLLHKLKGHTTSVIGVEAVRNAPQVVSADIDGTCKVWDMRDFQCVQSFRTFPVNEDIFAPDQDEKEKKQKLQGYLCCQDRAGGKLTRFVAHSHSLHFFEQAHVNVEAGADDVPITHAIFNEVSLTIITTSGSSVKIWNALTGKLMSVFRDMTSRGSDITAICLDDRQRKFILGDHNGFINVYNYQSGALMKSFDSHKSQVSDLVYIDEAKMVLSVSWDRTVVLHDELPPDAGRVLRAMDPAKSHKGDITAAAVSYSLSLIATGSSDDVGGGKFKGSVRVWDFETGKMEGMLEQEDEVDILALDFAHPYPVIFVTDSQGWVQIWGVRMSAYKYSLMYRFRNQNFRDAEEGAPLVGPGDKQVVPAINAFAWDNGADGDTPKLYTADDSGQVTAWDMSSVIKHLDVKPCTLAKRTTEGAPASHNVTQQAGEHVFKKIVVPDDAVRVLWTVTAHRESISQLQLQKSPLLLLTASYDHCVSIWDPSNGKRQGTLLQGLRKERNPTWELAVDVLDRECQEQGKALQVVRELCEVVAARDDPTHPVVRTNGGGALDVKAVEYNALEYASRRRSVMGYTAASGMQSTRTIIDDPSKKKGGRRVLSSGGRKFEVSESLRQRPKMGRSEDVDDTTGNDKLLSAAARLEAGFESWDTRAATGWSGGNRRERRRPRVSSGAPASNDAGLHTAGQEDVLDALVAQVDVGGGGAPAEDDP